MTVRGGLARPKERENLLAVGEDKTVAPASKAHHGAGSKAKRSPKDRSVIPGTVTKVSKVAVNRPGQVTATGWVQGGGPAPAGKIVWGVGTSRANGRGLVVLCPDNSPHQQAIRQITTVFR